MAIKIHNINIEKLGPIEAFQSDLGKLNMIFGHNESGKTLLVEFLLQSLFKHATKWNLRDLNTAGFVTIQGLESQEISFSPSSPKKLEDYWDQNNSGLPLNFARILVVRGGDLNLSGGSPGGVNREVLKNALTGQALLDQIRGKIQPTIRNAQIVNQKITGKNQGQIKDLRNIQNNLSSLEKLLADIDKKYSQGPARQLEIQIEEIEDLLEKHLNAKKHHAYLLALRRNDLLDQKKKYSSDIYLNLRDRIRDYHKLNDKIKNLKKEINTSKSALEDYYWLESAIDIWTENDLDNKGLPNPLTGLLGASLTVIGVLLFISQNVFLNQDLFWPGTITAIAGVCLLAIYGFGVYQWSQKMQDSVEKNAIQNGFREKFNLPLHGAADLKAQISLLKESYTKQIINNKDLDKFQTQLSADSGIIADLFIDILGGKVKQKDWDESLASIKDSSEAINTQINHLNLELSKLNLDEEEYLAKSEEVEFNPSIQKELEDSLLDFKTRLNTLHSDLETLKARACEWTRDDLSHPWKDVLGNLQQIHHDLSGSQKILIAELVAKIGLSQIIDQIEEEEDHKILDIINSDEISEVLQLLTGRYQNINLIDDQIYIEDPYRQYPLRDLSTGARDQVQLALRLGIAQHLSGGEPMFIILDDAFQHSDWERRESLVRETVNLAKKGWQIIYLSMDDHIRDLFQKIAKPVLKKDYKIIQMQQKFIQKNQEPQA